MKKYSIEEFFVADVKEIIRAYDKGNAFNSSKNLGKAIIKQDPNYSTYFYNVITGNEYRDSIWEDVGRTLVYNLIPLSTYIKDLHEEVKDIEFLSSKIDKIINTRLISKHDMKLIVKYLNNKEMFNKKRVYFNFLGKIPKKLSLKKDNTNISNNNEILLTDKKLQYNHVLGIEKELEELLIVLAQNKSNPILVGPNGTGKSTIIRELSRRIIKNEIPDFLKKKKIVDISRFITNGQYDIELKLEFNELIYQCIKNKWIVFIDNIENIVKINNPFTSFIRFSIKEKGLKVMGTITSNDKFNDFVYNSSDLYRSFTKILVNEPTNENLYEIIKQVFNNYSNENNIKLLDNMDFIINKLIELTKKENRIKNDNLYSDGKEDIYNPDLVVRIIDSIFAHAKVNNKKLLDIEDIIYAIDSCNYIKDDVKNNIKTNITTVSYFNATSKIQKKLIKMHITRDINNEQKSK